MKIMESIIKDVIAGDLENHKHYKQSQRAFRKWKYSLIFFLASFEYDKHGG